MAIWAVVWIFRFLQDVFIVTLYIILPLAFGLAVTPWFSNVGTSVISSSGWGSSVAGGFLMVDTFVLKILQAVLQALNAWGNSAARRRRPLLSMVVSLPQVTRLGLVSRCS